MRVMFLPLKFIVLISVLFVPTDIGIILLLIGLLLIVIPKGGTILDYIISSGYMKSTAGIIYTVNRADREKAKADGFTSLSLAQSFSLKGKFPEYKE